MTIEKWIIICIVAFIILLVSIVVGKDIDTPYSRSICILLGTLTILWMIIAVLGYTNTNTNKNDVHVAEENVQIIKVYDRNGYVIKQYEGKFDIRHEDNRIVFTDENSKEYSIYYSDVMITIDEK